MENVARMFWRTAHQRLDLGSRAVIMGILNVTPDSFSDAGEYLDVDRAVERGLALLDEGAAILDIGGESTRPGARPVSAEEESVRVLPVVAGILAARPEAVLSVDTSKASVAAAALALGAEIINDVSALRGDPDMAATVARAGAGVVLMHMQGDPGTMQRNPAYEDVAAEVRGFLEEGFHRALAAGIDAENVALDPGIGFGKTLAHNLTLLRRPDAWQVADRPPVLGVSRKAFLGAVTGETSIPARLWPTVALTALLRQQGARVLRVHDVRPNVAALRMAEAVLPF